MKIEEVQQKFGVDEATAKRIKNRAKKFGTTIWQAHHRLKIEGKIK